MTQKQFEQKCEGEARRRAAHIAEIAFPPEDAMNPSIALTSMCHALAMFVVAMQKHYPQRNMLEDTIRALRESVDLNNARRADRSSN